MTLKTERYLKSPGAMDAFRVVNTPVYIRKNLDTSWDAYVLLEPCHAEFSIAVGVRTKADAGAAVEDYLTKKFREG